ncbi:MAG: Auxin-binding protein [Ahrensia sp.]|nr:Auxin-binding protein [Ahrensia sp.]
MSNLLSRRSVLIGATISLLATGAACAGFFGRGAPKDLDLSLVRSTDAGRYLAEIKPNGGKPSVGPMHSWTLSLKATDGSPVDGASVSIDGGMPQHGHGLPTSPAVTKALGNGRYLIEGMRFNMRGWWVLDLGIDGRNGSDSIRFNVVI